MSKLGIDWSNIDTVLLDMDGTLLDLHFDNYFWLQHLPGCYARHHKISEEEALAELNKSFVGLRGTLNWYCLDYWSDLTGLPVAKLKLDVKHKIAFRPFVKTFLSALGEQRKRRVIVTNAHRGSLDLKLQETQLDQHVDRVISSHDYQEPKESAYFWERLLEDEPFDANRTLLIDDSISVLQAAQQWGIKQVLAITHPDSQQLPNRDVPFPSIDHFDELPWVRSKISDGS